jgi:superfamily I DNA and/or RNA helicase
MNISRLKDDIMTKQEIKQKEKQLLEITGTFCVQKLDDDYLKLCEKLIKKLGRKRDVPFQRGKLEIWAAAVIYAIGSINFLFDKSFEPYISAEQIHEYFGTKHSTVSNKAREIKEMFGLWHFNPEFSTKQMAESQSI